MKWAGARFGPSGPEDFTSLWFQFWHNRLVALWLILGLSLPVLLVSLDTFPAPWFDEGFTTNAALNLIETGVYGTRSGEGQLPFDGELSSGPPLVLPVALAFYGLGVGMFQARLALVPLALLALVMAYVLAKRLYGRGPALLIVLLWLGQPNLQDLSFVLISRQVLGETPALALVLLGIWLWFRSWHSRRIALALLAGGVLGLGVVAKMQLALPLVPALGLLALARFWHERPSWVIWFGPIATLLLVVVSWSFIQHLGTPTALRSSDTGAVESSIRTLLLTDAQGRNLGRTAITLLGISFGGLAVTFWRLSRQPIEWQNNRFWLEVLIALITLLAALWFAVLSVGWLRYFYIGWLMSLMLVGKGLWQALQWLARRWAFGQWLSLLTGVGLSLSALYFHFFMVWGFDDNGLRAMTRYLRVHVPAEARIVNWEWELEAPSGRLDYFHPSAQILNTAIRQKFHDQTDFNVEYDIERVAADYVIEGKISRWVQVYNPQYLSEKFIQEAAFGEYVLYRRLTD